MTKTAIKYALVGWAASCTAAALAEPAALREAAMRLDASDGTSLVLGTGGQVVEWRSQTGGVSAKPGKRRSPVFRLDAEKRPSVDFGKMGSDMDLSFPRIVGIRTVFAVGRFDSAMGCHVLCDGKQYDFHRGRTGEYASDEWSNVARVWNGTRPVYDIFREKMPSDRVLVLCYEVMDSQCAADRIACDRDLPPPDVERSGGRTLYELAVFKRVLSDEERLAISRHLLDKWRVADAAQAKAAVPEDWSVIKRDIDNWSRIPGRRSNAQAANIHACILPGDTDPLAVVLRRTRALLDDLSGAGANLAAERAELASLSSDATIALDEAPRVALFERVLALNRRVAFKNPLLRGIDKILFATHEPTGFFHRRDGTHMCDQYYGFHGTQNGLSRGDGLYILENPFSDHPTARNIIAGRKIVAGLWKGSTLDGCAIISPELDWDAKRVAFAATRAKNQLDNWNEDTCYHIFTCALDGSDLRQITHGPWNDFDPCWLPNGRLAFISERRGGYVRCSGDRPVPSFTLYSMFDDGSDIVRLSHHETNEWHPSVNKDGMIVYTRWDYVDRGHSQAHHAWTTFPDGRDPRELNGNTRLHHHTSPEMEANVRQIPGSGKYVATATPHHGPSYGSLITIDPTIPDDGEMSSIRRITPEQPFPESEQSANRNGYRYCGSYATAWPLSEKYFLCVYDPRANSMYDVAMRGRRYAIALVDVFGNKTRLYTHPTISCLDPIPVVARKRPAVIPHQTLEGRPADADGRRPAPIPAAEMPKTAEIGLVNVYDTRIPFPTNDPIVALRVWQLFPKTAPLQQRPWLGAEALLAGRQCLGTVPVEPDGSAYFTAPANVPLFFQALRADGCAVQSMRSDTYVHPGERLVCSGCHEPKENVRRTARTNLPAAMRRAPSRIRPAPEGAAPFNYARLVQPVLDRKCVSCHGEKRAAKAPDLRAGDWRKDRWGFSTSWKNLVQRTNYYARYTINKRRYVDYAFFEPAYTTPGRHLAIDAPLRKMLDAGHHGVKLTPEERERLITWMDSNGQYIAHDYNPEAQRDGKIVPPSLE